jgi:hypothetical protein
LRDRIEALEQLVERLRRLERLRAMELCLVAPAVEPGCQKAFFVCGGGVCAVRSLAPGAAAGLEIEAGLVICRTARETAAETLTLEQAEELVLLDGFIRRPTPELAVLSLDASRITGHLMRRFPRAA